MYERICERLLITLPRRVLKRALLQMKRRLAVGDARQSGAVIRVTRISDADCRARFAPHIILSPPARAQTFNRRGKRKPLLPNVRAQTQRRHLDRCSAEGFQPGLIRNHGRCLSRTAPETLGPRPCRTNLVSASSADSAAGEFCKMDVRFVSLICHLRFLEPCVPSLD